MTAGIGPVAREVWARTRLHVWPERYLLISLPACQSVDATGFAAGCPGFRAVVAERDEVSLTVAEGAWEERAGGALAAGARVAGERFRVITLDVSMAPDVVGYLAPAAARLATAGIPIIPQCAFRTDHLLVRESDLDAAVRILGDLIAACQP